VAADPATRTAGLADRVGPLVQRYVPITTWARAYPRAWLRADLTASVTSWVVMVPVALAYAGLAGVPPEVGLTTAFAALTAYAIFGTSRHVKVTASSTMAIMSAAVVVDLAGGDPALYLVETAALAMTVGLLLVAGGIARLGFVADFLTKSVVTGFIFGLSITIVVGQLPKLLGVPSVSGSVPDQLRQLVASLPETNPYTLAIGLTSLAVILLLRLISRRIPGPLFALVVGIVAVPLLNLEDLGVAVVGNVATGLPSLGLPVPPLSAIPLLLVGAVGIVFLAVGESVGAGRAFASRHHYALDADQELLALGTSNIATGLFGGFTADVSLSQTATADAAGAKSQLSSLVTAGLILATALFLAPLFADLPSAVLGAIVIAAALGLMDVPEMRRYLRWRRTDFAVALVALVGVVFTTVLIGLVIAVLLSVAFLLYRASRPYVAALGRVPGYRATFGDLQRHPDAEPIDDLLIVRLDAPLYFFNANVAKDQILDLVAARDPAPHGILIDLAATADLDVTTTDMLFELVGDLEERPIEVMLAQVKGSVRDRMRRTGLMERIGEDRLYLSVGSAVTDFARRRAAVAGSASAADAAAGPGGAAEPPAEVRAPEVPPA
jgi:high affinity sulfate transporter 1